MEKVRINHGRKRKWGGVVAGLAIVPHEKGGAHGGRWVRHGEGESRN